MISPTQPTTNKREVPFAASTMDSIPKSTPINTTQKTLTEPINIQKVRFAEETDKHKPKEQHELSPQRKLFPIPNFNTSLQSKQIILLGEEQEGNSPHSPSSSYSPSSRTPSPSPKDLEAHPLQLSPRKSSEELASLLSGMRSSEGLSAHRSPRKSSEGLSSHLSNVRSSEGRILEQSPKKSSEGLSSHRSPRKSSDGLSSQVSHIKSSEGQHSHRSHRKSSSEDHTLQLSPKTSAERKSPKRSHRKNSGEHSSIETITIPLTTFLNFIQIPTTSILVWKNKMIDVILDSIFEPDPALENVLVTVNKTYNNALKYSTMLRRIEKANELFNGMHEYQYLNEFSGLSNPSDFWKKCEELKSTSETHFYILFNIIGGEEPFQIISECSKNNGNLIKLEFQKSFYEISNECKEKESFFLKSSFHFSKNFDTENMHIFPIPISYSNCTEFKDTFRSYYFPVEIQRPCMRYNEEVILTPSNSNKSVSTKQMDDYLAEYLILQIQEKTGLHSYYDAKKQLKLFALTPEEQPNFNRSELKQSIINALIETIPKTLADFDQGTYLNSFFEALSRSKFSKNFSDQLHVHFNCIWKYLKKHKGVHEKDWDRVAEDLINVYFRVYKLEEKRKFIPCLSLYKAITSCNFESGNYLLKNFLCPDLYKMNNRYKLIPDLDAHTDYHISHLTTNNPEGLFQVTHIKPFKIIFGEKTEATFFIHWKVQGSLHSLDYNTFLESTPFVYSLNCSQLERSHIWKLFSPNLPETPLGSFLSKQEKKAPIKANFATSSKGINFKYI